MVKVSFFEVLVASDYILFENHDFRPFPKLWTFWKIYSVGVEFFKVIHTPQNFYQNDF